MLYTVATHTASSSGWTFERITLYVGFAAGVAALLDFFGVRKWIVTNVFRRRPSPLRGRGRILLKGVELSLGLAAIAVGTWASGSTRTYALIGIVFLIAVLGAYRLIAEWKSERGLAAATTFSPKRSTEVVERKDNAGELFDTLFPFIQRGLDILNGRNRTVGSDLADRAAERWIDRVRELTEGGYPDFALYFTIPDGMKGRPRHDGQCGRLHELVPRLNFFLRDLKALWITYASYGAGTKTMNPRDRLNGLIKNDRLNFIVDDATMGDDPAPGEEKRLILRWVQDGQERDSSFKVGTHVGLPSRPESKPAEDETVPETRAVASPVSRDMARRFRGAVEAGLTHGDREAIARFGDELDDFFTERNRARPPELDQFEAGTSAKTQRDKEREDHDAETVRLYHERYATQAIDRVREARELGFLSEEAHRLAREPFRTDDILTLATRLKGLRPATAGQRSRTPALAAPTPPVAEEEPADEDDEEEQEPVPRPPAARHLIRTDGTVMLTVRTQGGVIVVRPGPVRCEVTCPDGARAIGQAVPQVPGPWRGDPFAALAPDREAQLIFPDEFEGAPEGKLPVGPYYVEWTIPSSILTFRPQVETDVFRIRRKKAKT